MWADFLGAEEGRACSSVTEGRSDDRRTVRSAWSAWGRPGFFGRPVARWQAVQLLLGLVAGLTAGQWRASAQSVANAGLETGTFTSAGSFAGGTYQTFNAGTPASWVRAIGVGDARWVNSTAAHGGSKYAYAYSSGDVITGNDACLQNTLTGLTIGNCYTVSVWAAEAGGSVNNPAGNPSVMTMEFQNGANFEYGRYFIPNNPAWNDSALTTIPWAQYSYTFTAAATSVNFWVSANAYNGVTGYMVADDVTVTTVSCGAVTYDYGDLQVTTGSFNTTGGGTAANAPRHQIGATGTLRLGSTIDAEANGQPSTNADGDDLATGPDEDGVTFPTLVENVAANITIKVTGPSTGKLNAWIDWNNNGSFADAGEQIASNVTMTGGAWNAPGSNTRSVTPPVGVVKGTPLAARFRLSLAGSDAATTGTAVSGEIEDYMVVVTGTDWGDLPDTGAGTAANNYNTLSTDSGPSHSIINSLKLGATVDPEAGTLQNGTATLDDTTNTGSADDEDGVDFTGVTFTQGVTASLPVTVTKTGGGTAKLNAFFDWNNDGDFGDPGEALTQVAVTVPVGGSTVVSLSVPVPAGATVGANHGARFRLSTAGTTLSTGSAADGEVEDYLVTVQAEQCPDGPATIGAGGSVNLINARYDYPSAGRSTWYYSVTGASSGNAFSHTVFQMLCPTIQIEGAGTWNGSDQNALTSGGGAPAPGSFPAAPQTDPTSGVKGLKFDLQLNNNTTRYYYFTVNGNYASGGITFAAKPGTSVVTTTVCGPANDCALAQDYGDLPDTGAGTGAGNYKTLLSDGGPSHVIVSGLNLGAAGVVDADTGLLQNAGATLDDSTNTGFADDEDGVASFPTFKAGQSATVAVTVNNPAGGVGAATLYGFIDWNNDGDFGDTGEAVSAAVADGTVGTVNLVFNVPAAASVGTGRGARFRLTTDTLTVGDAGAIGAATNGEVEDYVVTVAAGEDFGDLPDTGAGTGAGNYKTLLSDNGPRHTIVSGLNIGAASSVDADTGLLQNTAADQDDTTNTGVVDDEAGIASFPTFTAGQSATVAVTVSNPAGGIGAATLYGFIDWNNDGDFGDTGEATSVAVPDGTTTTVNLVFSVPIGAVLNTSLGARFRLTTDTLTVGDAGSVGLASNGEVEDYLVSVVGKDYGDLPDTGAGTGAGNYNTLSTDSGPNHSIINALKLGSTVDADTGLLQGAGATLDDTTNTGSADDEDGVTIPVLSTGATATVVVNASGTGKVNAFFDWNNDGDFLDSGEAITELSVVAGNNNLSVPVPTTAVTGTSLGARFRISTAGALTATGAAADGEVEDYVVTVLGTDYGDLPDTGAGTSANNYETLLASGGARHVLSNALKLGSTVDADTGLLQGAGATLDDTTNTGSADDEDGVDFTGVTFVQGLNSTLPVTVTLTGGGTVKLNAFFDWNNDGDFLDSGEALTEVSVTVPGGGSTVVSLSVPVPATATVAANHGARFRISTAGGLTSVGSASDGEVEDYVFSVVAPTVRLGNRVWADTDNSGTINGAEVGINGVTVQVYAADASGNPTGSVLATTTTATATLLGYYAFNLLPGDYVVVIPASNFGAGQPLVGLYSSGTSTGTFNGIDPDTTPTDSDDNGFNAINPASTGVRSAAVTLTVAGEPTGEDNNNGLGGLLDNSVNFTVDFGFVSAAPTAIKLGYVKGWWQDGQVTVEGETVSELETLGFDLYRLEGGKRIRVNADLVAALNVERGGVYRVTEAMTKPTGPLSYLLVEQEITGKQIEYGPFTVLVQSGASVSSVDVRGGALEFRFKGEPGATYQVESTGDMVHGRWTRVGTATADADGVLLFRQPIGGSDPVRFYRALKP